MANTVNRAVWHVTGAAALLLLLPSAGPAQTPDGKALYQAKCGGCHSLDTNRIGPAHRGIVGRRIATAPGYPYSAAIKRLPGVWTAPLLDRWLTGPQKLAPGNKMYLTINDAGQRAAIIAYLGSASSPTPPR